MGFMGTCPIAGVVWQHVHYIVGLQRLGHEVYYIEDTARNYYNPATFDVSDDSAYCATILSRLASEFGFEHRWGFCNRQDPAHPCFGLTRDVIQELYRTADAVFNVCGSQDLHDDLECCESLLYIESDPGVEQIKVDLGDTRTLAYLKRHRRLFTFGELVPTAAFPVPLHGLRWIPTRQPVVTDFWFTGQPAPPDAVFTSVANWSTSGKKDIDWRGDTYLWSKSLEFLKFVEAPAASEETFELATDIGDAEVRSRFEKNQWRLVLPHNMSAEYEDYRHYFQHSKGEFTAAKDQYIRLHTGWFSDRSACYLAAGRPVITQDTGFSKLGWGEGGLFAFRTLEEIREAVRAINADYAQHCRAAHSLACERFEAVKVCRDILDQAGV